MDEDLIGRFAGSTVLVVGAGTGIGRAAAQRLAVEGARVGVADLERGMAAETTAMLVGDGHLVLELDVLDERSVDEAVAQLVEEVGGLDGLVHVSGGDTAHGRFTETGDEVWRAMAELNLLGPVRVLRAALPHLERSERSPGAVLVSSVNALRPLGSEPYSAAKAGLGALVANLAAEYGPNGVRVNAVAPGTIRTRNWDAQGGPDHLAVHYPLGRVGEPSDVAAAIAFLCSSDAAWITGHVLPVDGGLLAKRMF